MEIHFKYCPPFFTTSGYKETLMNRNLRLSLICVFLFLFASQVQAEVNLTKLVQKIQPAVVTVINYKFHIGVKLYDEKIYDEDIVKQGSGFCISKKDGLATIVTNFHVLIPHGNGCPNSYAGGRAAIIDRNGQQYTIHKVIAENKDLDLITVLAQIPEGVIHQVRINEAPPSIAERVMVVGSPMGLEQTVSEGIISAVRNVPITHKQIYQISTPVSPGSSGSPVVNMRGEVIGVVSSQIAKGQNLNFAIPIKYIKELKQVDEFYRNNDFHTWARGRHAQLTREFVRRNTQLYVKGMEYYVNHDYQNAISNFKRLIECCPNYTEYYIKLGWSQSNLNQDREAKKSFKQAIEINPNNADGYDGLGNVYLALNQLEEAKKAYLQAIRIEPNHSGAHLGLGVYYSAVGNKKEALNEYEILKTFDKGAADILFKWIYK